MYKVLVAVATLGLVLGSTVFASATGNHSYECPDEQPMPELQGLTISDNNYGHGHHRHHKVCEPEVVDVCPNVEGVQEAIPEGQVKDEQGNCVDETPVPEPEPTPEPTPQPAPPVVEQAVVETPVVEVESQGK